MPKQESVEVGDAPIKGEGRVRRWRVTQDKLVTTPDPSVTVIANILANSAKKYPEKPAVGWRDLRQMVEEEKEVEKKVDGKVVKEKKTWSYYELEDYKYLTYRELYDKAMKVGSALVETGHSNKTIFNIYSSTGVNWQVFANACASQSITFATAYDSLGEEGLQHSLAQPDCYGVFTNAALVKTIAAVIDKTPTVKILVYDGKKEDVASGALDKIKDKGVKIYHIDEFVELGQKKPTKPNLPQPEDIACIMYTSGSTGAPKGVLLSNGNVIAAIAGAVTMLKPLITPDARYIAFLPLAHIFEFAVEVCMLFMGVPMGYGTVKTLTDTSVRNCVGDIRAFKPTIMCGVPAVWELIRKGILAKVKAGGKEGIFNFAFSAKKNAPWPVGKIMDAVVFKQVKQATGGKLKYAINGGAALSRETQEFLNISLVDTIIQGYGMTESSALSFILPPHIARPGVVGVPTGCTEAKLVDFADANYFSTNDPPQGEVWIRGAGVTKGYYKLDDVTQETITEDGWLKTGDIGQWNPDGTLSIIDRKKNLIKLSGGEYIAVERLESIYKSCSVVNNICVHADGDANRPMAIIFAHEANLKTLAKEQNLGADKDFDGLVKDSAVKKAVQDELNQVAKRAGLKSLEHLQTVVLTSFEWTPQSGMLTAAQKLQRKAILEKYNDEIKKVYP